MKCPRCGKEMTTASHRKYAVPMCYECGYMEGRKVDNTNLSATNFEHLRSLNLNEMAAFLSEGLGVDRQELVTWLDDQAK